MKTVRDALISMEKNVVGFRPSWRNPRFLGHDAIHCIIGLYADFSPQEKPKARRIEEIVGIYQSVLMNDPHAHRGMNWENCHEDVTLADIHAKLIPDLGKFVERVGLRGYDALSHEDIRSVFNEAQCFKRGFEKKFGHEFADMSIEELLDMDVDTLRTMVSSVSSADKALARPRYDRPASEALGR